MTVKQYVGAMRLSVNASASLTPHEAIASTQPNFEAFLLPAPVFETWKFHRQGHDDCPTDANAQSMGDPHIVNLNLRDYMDALEAAVSWREAHVTATSRDTDIDSRINHHGQYQPSRSRQRS
jgi:hypothetical protein